MNKIEIGITGSTGILGSLLCKKLQQNRLEYSSFKGDISIKSEVESWILKNKFKYIFHLAAIVPIQEVESNKIRAYEVNVGGILNLVSSINKCDYKPWLFFSSSSHIYKSSFKPITENNEIKPISFYGKTKYFGEEILKDSIENLCIGRIFSFFHETQKGSFLFPKMKQRLKIENLDEKFTLFGGNSTRDFLNAESVVEYMYRLMSINYVGVLNIASGKETKISDFVQSLSVKKLKFKIIGNCDKLVADINKLNKLFEK